MNVYLDASALVKRYVAEQGSEDVAALIAASSFLVTNIITRVEVAAALQRAVRMRLLGLADANQSLTRFRADWERLLRLPVSEITVELADALAVKYDLRAYDAVHLAAALSWQETLRRTVTMATYDRELWQAAARSGLDVWPPGAFS